MVPHGRIMEKRHKMKPERFQGHGPSEFIYGSRAILEAIDSDREIDRVLMQKGLSNTLSRELLTALNKAQIPVQMVPGVRLDQITRKNHQGALAYLSPFAYANIEQIVDACFRKGVDPLIVVVDEVTDIRNIGAMIRSMECFGAHALLIGNKGTARLGADAMKTSSGALNRMPVCRSANLKATLQLLRNSGLQLVAASEKGSNELEKSSLSGPLALIMGSEEKGVSPIFLKMADQILQIPMSGSIASLNVAVSAGIFLYEARRQRSLQRN